LKFNRRIYFENPFFFHLYNQTHFCRSYFHLVCSEKVSKCYLQGVTIKFLHFDSFSNKNSCNGMLRRVRYAKVLQMSVEIMEVINHFSYAFFNLSVARSHTSSC
jgi:hypothetical protein